MKSNCQETVNQFTQFIISVFLAFYFYLICFVILTQRDRGHQSPIYVLTQHSEVCFVSLGVFHFNSKIHPRG